MLAGMPALSNLPSKSSPGVTMVALIGSSILKPSASLPKPCHLDVLPVPLITQLSARPMPSSTNSSGPQTLNHQSLPYSSSTLRMARLKSSASAMLSSTKAVPLGGSIMAAATSQLAMMLYCGLVLVCIKYASLNKWRSNLFFWESCTNTWLAWLIPANSLWMDWVE